MNNNNINQLLINNINNNNQNIMNNIPSSSNIIHQILELNNQSIQLQIVFNPDQSPITTMKMTKNEKELLNINHYDDYLQLLD